MNYQAIGLSLALAGFGALLPASAQLTSANSASAPQAPYTAEFKITHVQTLANGATITRETRVVMARDAAGRTLTSTTQIPSSPSRPELTFSFVHDPVSNTRTTWDSRSERAHVTQLVPQEAGPGCWSIRPGNGVVSNGGGSATGSVLVGSSPLVAVPASSPPAAVQLPDTPGSAQVPGAHPALLRPVREDLGSDTILGVDVKGERITRTVPAGQIGNDVPLVSTEEIWTAPSLGIVLRQLSDSPQSGKTTREAVSLDLNDPDPSIFQPPEGYEVTTEEIQTAPCEAAH
jgi:hypothetical protein